jgi:hypothetical protein
MFWRCLLVNESEFQRDVLMNEQKTNDSDGIILLQSPQAKPSFPGSFAFPTWKLDYDRCLCTLVQGW